MSDMFPEEIEVVSSGGFSDAFPVDVEGCEKLVCRACNASAMVAGPLAELQSQDRFGGFHPWASYKRIRDSDGNVVAKKPKGRLCRICVNVWSLSGWECKHGDMQSYLKTMSTPSGKVEHKEFLHKVKQYIDFQKKNESGNKMLHLGAKAAVTKSTLQTVSARGQKYCAPKRDFVEVDAWDPAQDGDLSKATIVEEFIHGKQRRGAWVIRGRPGVYSEENFESKAAEDVTVEDDNEGLFGDERKALKRKSLEDGLNALEAGRAKVAVQGPRVAADMSVDEMLKLVACMGGDDKNRSGSAQVGVALESDDQSSDSEASSEDEKGAIDEGAHLRSFFSGVSAIAKANTSKSGSKSTSSIISSNQKRWRTLGRQPVAAAAAAAATAGSPISTPEAAAPARSQAAAAGRREELKLDGRSSRLRGNLEKRSRSLKFRAEIFSSCVCLGQGLPIRRMLG